MTQTEAILAHLETGESITPMDALNLFGCFRLAARIKDLRDAGHNILTTTIDDGMAHYASYSLARKPSMQCAADGQGMLL